MFVAFLPGGTEATEVISISEGDASKTKKTLIKLREGRCLMSMLFLGAGASNAFGIGQ